MQLFPKFDCTLLTKSFIFYFKDDKLKPIVIHPEPKQETAVSYIPLFYSGSQSLT